MTVLMSKVIKVGQVSQGNRKDKKVECAKELLIVVSRNIKQDNPSWSRRLVFAPILEPANREVRGSTKKELNCVLSVERAIMADRRHRNHFGIHTRKPFEKPLDAAMQRVWEPGKQE